MSFRKFKADQLFDGFDFLPSSTVLITDDKGKIDGFVNESDAGADVEHFSGIIAPGFINCHCHLELSHMKKKISRNTGLVEFVSAVMKNREASTEEILDAITSAEKEMLKNGIVAVGDICNTTHTLAQKAKHKMRYYNFIEATGFVEINAAERFATSKKILEAFADLAPSMIVPHAPYSVSIKLLNLISGQEEGGTMSMHNQESEAEDLFFNAGSGDFQTLYKKLGIDISFFKHPGKSSLSYIMDYLYYKGNLILVHNVTTSEEDIIDAETKAKADDTNLFWCLCPEANQFISGTTPPVDVLMNAGVEIVFGTDSLASNDGLSVLEEIKTIKRYFADIPTEVLLKWATSNGAKALQFDNTLGSFEKGKTPGVIFIEGVDLNSDSRVTRLI